ncbi:MAG: hypothetical protein II655_09295, partial [Thermoguttaceae bacterium]|nr:hypothetical protein [Thermoguttaceae bacterium]
CDKRLIWSANRPYDWRAFIVGTVLCKKFAVNKDSNVIVANFLHRKNWRVFVCENMVSGKRKAKRDQKKRAASKERLSAKRKRRHENLLFEPKRALQERLFIFIRQQRRPSD